MPSDSSFTPPPRTQLSVFSPRFAAQFALLPLLTTLVCFGLINLLSESIPYPLENLPLELYFASIYGGSNRFFKICLIKIQLIYLLRDPHFLKF
jgi:hypothetical protein